MMLALRDTAGPSGDSMALSKTWLITIGIFIWEFVTGLHYEWDVIRGRRTYRWTIWIYSIARWSTIVFVILVLINLTVTFRVSCEAWVRVTWSFSFLSLSSGSLLLMLRIFAIWNKNKGITAIIAIICVTNLSLLVLAVVQIHSVWDPVAEICIVPNIKICEISMVSFLVTDTSLLLIMLAGLLRLRRCGRGSYALWHFLWKQGVVWFVVAAVAELPPAVLMIMNVNDVLDVMLVLPSLVAMIIATTRMYRSLQYFAPFSSTEPDSNDDQKTGNSRLVSKTKNPSTLRIPSNRLEVAIHTAYEEYPMSQINHCGSYPDKPRELDIDDKVERCASEGH